MNANKAVSFEFVNFRISTLVIVSTWCEASLMCLLCEDFLHYDLA